VTIIDLVSQLEEAKFLRLFRHLVDLPDPQGEERLNLAAVPIGLRNAELWLKPAGRIGSVRSWAESWVFHIAHLPVGVWTKPVICEFAKGRLTKAFDALLGVDEPRNLLLGDHLDCAREGLFAPARCTYHFFTNAIVGLDGASVTGITDIARRLFEERFGVPAGQDISFGLGNPETILRGAYDKHVETLLLDLLNMPSSYYFVARQGEIIVAPATEHGAFYAHAPERRLQGATATSSLPKSDSVWSKGLSDLQTLINAPRTKEADLQKFFEEHPQFLFALDERYCEVRPRIGLIDGSGTSLIPDFLVRLEGAAGWDAIELKRPQHRITVGAHRETAAKSAAAAIAQLLTYRDFFALHENRRRVSHRFGAPPYEPCLLVVIGRGSPNTPFRWRSAPVGVPEVKIVTYDFLFERAREAAARLATHTGAKLP
jgi:hypothetical protein